MATERTIKFVPTSKSNFLGRPYDLIVDGVKIGFAFAKKHRDATGLTRVSGTVYEAKALDRWFSGSRKTVAREIQRAMAKAEQQ